jgi:hypothetical protein
MVNPVSSAKTGAAVVEPTVSKEQPAAASTASPRVQARDQLNAAIVQSSISVAIGSGNEALAPDFGPDAVQKAAGQDNTPEGTAGRIVSLSTAFFDAFKAQHKGEDEGAVLQKFVDTLQGGVDQGFKEARGILGGMKVLQGDIAGNIDKTESLVRQGLADFLKAHQPASSPAAG